MTKLKKNASLSLSLLVDLLMHFDIPERMCAYQSLSLFLSIYICKNGLDPDQTRMEFRKECFVNLKMCACEVRKVSYKRRYARYNGFSVYLNKCIDGPVPSADPEGGQGVRIPLKIHKNIEFLSNTVPDPLKFSRLPSQHSTLGHHRHASETPFKFDLLAGR